MIIDAWKGDLSFDDLHPSPRALEVQLKPPLKYTLTRVSASASEFVLLRQGAGGKVEKVQGLAEQPLKILACLLQRRYQGMLENPAAIVPRLVSYEELETELDIPPRPPEHGQIYTLMRHLRDALYDNPKLDDRQASQELIQTKSGSGYYFVQLVHTDPLRYMRPVIADAAFDSFFGVTNDRLGAQGALILPANTIDQLVNGSEANRALSGTDRPLKARRWLNAYDILGAKYLLDLFHSRSSLPPKLVYSYPRVETKRDDPSFEITLGGQAGTTSAELEGIGKGWLRVDMCEDSGDTLFVHRELISSPRLRKDPEEADGLSRILPADWSSSWMGRWSDRVRDPGVPIVNEYAMILRNTTEVEDDFGALTRKVQFFLIGFTEIGTAAAGRYLAKKWRNLWEEWVKEQISRKSRGDFLALITGPSDAGKLGDWRRAEMLTPETVSSALSGKIDNSSPWIYRLGEDSTVAQTSTGTKAD